MVSSQASASEMSTVNVGSSGNCRLSPASLGKASAKVFGPRSRSSRDFSVPAKMPTPAETATPTAWPRGNASFPGYGTPACRLCHALHTHRGALSGFRRLAGGASVAQGGLVPGTLSLMATASLPEASSGSQVLLGRVWSTGRSCTQC